MGKKLFWILFAAVLVFAYVLRVIPAQNNNFFFTMDQGDDAVHAREFWQRGQVILKGPETGIRGIFAGPGWYYFISVGYWLFAGHPFGALFMVILLSLATAAVLMWQVCRHVGWWQALVVGASLQGFWFFYDTSRWAFNPFALVFLSVVLVLLLGRFLEGQSGRWYILGVVPIILGFNAEVAGALALFLLYVTVGAWGLLRRKLDWRIFTLVAGIVPTLAAGVVTKPIILKFLNTHVLAIEESVQATVGTFSGTNFLGMAQVFLERFAWGVIPQSAIVSILIFTISYILFLRVKKPDKFQQHFVNLVLVLFAISYLFFATNKGWRDWHTVWLPVLVFTSLLLMLLSVRRAVGMPLLALVIALQLSVFVQRYRQYLQPSNDPAILGNQLAVLDWIYQNNEDDGFDVYTFMRQSDKDYPYQYHFWWYGRGKYGFVPCEYSNFPKSIKYLYVAGALAYSEPKLGCTKLTFLIIESGGDQERFAQWYQKASDTTVLLNQAQLGQITVEKRKKQQI